MNYAFFGILFLLIAAFVFSEAKRRINLRLVLSALALQAGIAAFVLYTPFGKAALEGAQAGVQTLIAFGNSGITFLFGELATDKVGFIFAFRVLPVIIFVSALMAALYHLRIMQLVVAIIGGAIRLLIGSTRIESLCAASNIFVGPIEAALTVRPYIRSLSRSQLFAVMAVGLSSVSGAILVGYAGLGVRLDYLIAAAFMAAPGGLVMAKILVPDTESDKQSDIPADADAFDGEGRAANVIEAAANGAASGAQLAINIGAMLIAFIALISMANGIVGGIAGALGFAPITIEQILGYALSPLMVLLGVPWGPEAVTAGNLIAQKTILNEFIAFAQFTTVKDGLSDHTEAVITFALCGFANLNALAIVYGGLGGMAPERKHEIAELGARAVYSASLANLMSAAIAGALLSL